MNNEHLQRLSEFESKFAEEMKGEGSLSPYAAADTANFSKSAPRDEVFYVGYDIHPENLEALYFEGLKLPRWESLGAGTVAEKTDIYQKALEKNKSEYPLISRVTDTDQKIAYAPEEVLQLREECRQVLDNTNDEKVIAALLKFYIACDKAADRRMGLLLIPSR